MIRRRFSEYEIQKILQKYEEGATVQNIIQEYGISQATFYNWRAKYNQIQTYDILKLNKLKDDNERLKKMFAEISLENETLKSQLKKRD
jgi:putative transposase